MILRNHCNFCAASFIFDKDQNYAAMSKIKDYLENSGVVGRIVAFLILVVWCVNLIGGTAYHFWASKTLLEAEIIHSGFGIFGIFNLLVSAMAFPIVLWAWNLLMDAPKPKD